MKPKITKTRRKSKYTPKIISQLIIREAAGLFFFWCLRTNLLRCIIKPPDWILHLGNIRIMVVPHDNCDVICKSIAKSFAIFCTKYNPIPVERLKSFLASPVKPFIKTNGRSDAGIPVPLSLTDRVICPLSGLSVTEN